MEPIRAGRWDLPASYKYDKIFEITDENHDQKVMGSEDAWIVVFFKKKLHKKWRELAEVISGAVWFGSVDIDKEAALARRVNIDMAKFDKKTGIAVIYPMARVKKQDALVSGELKTTTGVREAELLTSRTIPDRTVEIDFSPEGQQKFNDWIVKGYYYEQPSKFPVICITDGSETPIHVKVLSHYMYTHFTFGIVQKRNVPAMRQLFKQVPEPQTYPSFLVLLGKEPSGEEMSSGEYNMRFNIMPYIDKKYGDARQFSPLLNFLMTANTDYRKNLPGRMASEPDSIANLDGIRRRLTQRVSLVFNEKKNRPQKTEL
ncbi:uncharacterized protein LOC144428096 isoform X2 [Styela clava]